MIKVLNPSDNPKLVDREIIDEVIVVNATKPEFGTICLQANDGPSLLGGFVSHKRDTVFLAGRLEDLSEAVKQYGMKPGKQLAKFSVQVTESTVPSFENQLPKINPATGNVICTVDGEMVYRHTTLVEGAATDKLFSRSEVQESDISIESLQAEITVVNVNTTAPTVP